MQEYAKTKEKQLQLTPKGYVVTNRVPFGFDGWVQGVVATVLEVHTLKPLDTEAIASLAR